MAKRLFTTTEVGNLLGVHQGTIVRWIDIGRLNAFSTIGGHRRIKYVDLVRFCKENDMPVPSNTEKSKKNL